MQEPITITLKHPITVGSTVTTELVFPPLTARHLRGLKVDGGPIDQMLNLATAMTGRSYLVMDQLDVEDDLPRVLEVVSGFLDKFPGIGKLPSAT